MLCIMVFFDGNFMEILTCCLWNFCFIYFSFMVFSILAFLVEIERFESGSSA